ncbi:MAG: M23 family peptidase, partial [Pseudomonadota bacterium]
MKIRRITAGFGIFAALTAGGLAISGIWSKDPVPPGLAAATAWSPAQLQLPTSIETALPLFAQPSAAPARPLQPMPQLNVAIADTLLPTIEPPLANWSREIASGETLDAVLEAAGLSAADRAEVALALGAEYDLRRLRPGHSVTVVSTMDGSPRSVALSVEDGVRIEAIFGEELATQVVTPDPEFITLAGEAVIDSSLFAALEDARMPARFAVDLAQMLGGTVDFRREMTGGETLRLLWREARV